MPSLTELPVLQSVVINLITYRVFSKHQNGYWLAVREVDIVTNSDAAPIYIINIDA